MRSVPELIVQVCKQTHVPIAQAVFGNEGIDAIFRLMEMAKALYRHVEPERVSGEIVMFRRLAPQNAASARTSVLPIDFAQLSNKDIDNLVLEVADDGNAYAASLVGTSLEQLATEALVYRYHNGAEEFLAGTERRAVERLDLAARSQFSVPTFLDLRDALQRYHAENITESTCYIFQQVWSHENRIFFVAGPEELMRRSLTQFLRNRLSGEHDVWPEQNVNEKNPVDIRVMPRFNNNRLMLIEIKWVGDSVAADGHFTAQPRDAYAQKGSDQLARYIDEQRKFAPTRTLRGYFVIIDGRRANARRGMTTISKADGLHYENIEINLDPAYHNTRDDFEPPYRMFARPVCSD